MSEHRLGDVLDDYCIKCKRLTNHQIVSVVEAEPAKVRCRSCYNDHDYRREVVPPTKKELKKQQELDDAIAKAASEAPSAETPV
jgi:hypothetical protein